MSRLSDLPLLALRIGRNVEDASERLITEVPQPPPIDGAEHFYDMLSRAVDELLHTQLASPTTPAQIEERVSALKRAMNLARPLMTRENVVSTVNWLVSRRNTEPLVSRRVVRRIAYLWNQKVLRDEAKETLKSSIEALLDPDREPKTPEEMGPKFVQIMQTAEESGVLTLVEVETCVTELLDVTRSAEYISNEDLLQAFLNAWVEASNEDLADFAFEEEEEEDITDEGAEGAEGVLRHEAKETLKRSIEALLDPDREPKTEEEMGPEFVKIMQTAKDSGVLGLVEIATWVTELLDVTRSAEYIVNEDLLQAFLNEWVQASNGGGDYLILE